MAAHQGWEGDERQATRREMCMDSAPMSGGSMCRVVVAGVSAIALFCLAASAGEHARPAGMLESFDTGPDPDAPGGNTYIHACMHTYINTYAPGGNTYIIHTTCINDTYIET